MAVENMNGGFEMIPEGQTIVAQKQNRQVLQTELGPTMTCEYRVMNTTKLIQIGYFEIGALCEKEK